MGQSNESVSRHRDWHIRHKEDILHSDWCNNNLLKCCSVGCHLYEYVWDGEEWSRRKRWEDRGELFPGDIAKYKTSQFKPNRYNKTFKILIKVWTCDPLLWTTNLKFEISLLYYKAIYVNIYYFKMHKRLYNLYKWKISILNLGSLSR